MEDRYKKSKENKIEIKRQNGIKTNWLKIYIESQKKNNEKRTNNLQYSSSILK